MVARTASLDQVEPDAAGFVRFCYRRRRVGWPELYDEMCAVAARGLYRGMGPDELAGLGIGLSLFDMPAVAALATRIIAEEQAKRRPVAVAIVTEPTAVPVGAESTPVPVESAVPAGVLLAAAADEPEYPTLVMIGEAGVDVAPSVPVRSREERLDRPVEREIDVPIRLSAAPAGA
jgi:hypothetical protein